MYNKIYDFCKIRNLGSVLDNIDVPTPRVVYLMSLLDSMGIEYVLDKWVTNRITCYNIIMKGSSDKMVVAHHDVVNINTDNANDNSASIINAIMVKKLMPNINVVLLDGEEYGGKGSNRVSEQINTGYYGSIKWVLNFELTGSGGKYFFIGNYPGLLQDHILSLFNCPIVRTPFNDSVIFRQNGIDSVVINPLPVVDRKTSVKWDDNTYLDLDLLFNCHTAKDTLDTISTDDMREFVEDVVIPILK